MLRREALRLAGVVMAAGFAAGTASADDAPPKGPKIAPPPEDNGKPELTQSQMVGLSLRVIKPGQVVTQEYNDSRLTVVIDKNSLITDIRVG